MLKHVVVVTDSLSVDGGSAKVALGSARALAAQGLQVTVFAAGGRISEELADTDSVQIVNTNQGEALSQRNRIGGALRGLWNLTAAKRLAALLSTLDRRHTVVHVHGWTKALSSSIFPVIKRSGFPVVVTLHEYFSACPNGCLYLHRAGRVCNLKPMSLACITTDCDSRNYGFKLYRVVRQMIQRWFGKMPAAISTFITVSDFSRRVLEPMLPANGRFYAIDNPVDAQHEPRATPEANRDFVYIGRLSAEKGGTLLAEAARRANARVVFVGDGSERAQIARVNPEACFVGWLDRDGVRAQLQSARCVVVPSVWYETLGLVVLEAAALGIPAIVPTGTAAHDLVLPNVTGLDFPRGDVDALTERLRQIASDDALVRGLSEHAYGNYWRRPLTMAAHVERLCAVYSSVLGAATSAMQPPVRRRLPNRRLENAHEIVVAERSA
jgi:glycosyltransferase involved in cell wall biosynthesis